MQAAVYYGPGDIRVEDRPAPKATSANVIVQVHCCAICGTDVKLSTIGHQRCTPPRIIGHEMVGHIVHIGEDVAGWAEGERVTLATTVACGDCSYCRLGLGNMCPNSLPIGLQADGAFAELLAVPPAAIAGGNLIKVPDNVPDEAAALSEPLSCVINAQQIAGVKAGDSVLVIGGGPLGALHAETAKARGATNVMIVQRSEPRLSLLRTLQEVLVIDGAHQDVGDVVNENTDGLGAAVVIVAAPSREAQEQSIYYARKGGAISLFASLPNGDADITYDSRIIHYRELRLAGASDSRPDHVALAVQLMAEGKIAADAIVTHKVPLDNLHEGLRLMEKKQSLKVLVYPSGD